MSKEEFIRLVEKYQRGQCTQEEIKRLDQWYDRLGGNVNLDMGNPERLGLKRKLWEHINEKIDSSLEDQKPLQVDSIRTFKFTHWVYAAMLVLVGTVTFLSYRLYWQRGNNLATAVSSGADEQTNTTRQAKQLVLSDGSRVELRPQSTIRFTNNPGSKKREVWLKGKAFFQVKRDPSRPFFVYTGAVVTRVVGTSFWVTTSSNAKTVVVSVRTGKVAVYKASDAVHTSPNVEKKEPVLLTPNQKVTFASGQANPAVTLVEAPEPIPTTEAPAQGQFTYSSALLPEVVSQLEQAYGIEIKLSTKTLANCRFTGDISQQPLYSKLELICQSLNAQFQVQGTRIMINGTGCTL